MDMGLGIPSGYAGRGTIPILVSTPVPISIPVIPVPTSAGTTLQIPSDLPNQVVAIVLHQHRIAMARVRVYLVGTWVRVSRVQIRIAILYPALYPYPYPSYLYPQ
jgi:hypothetical protein